MLFFKQLPLKQSTACVTNNKLEYEKIDVRGARLDNPVKSQLWDSFGKRPRSRLAGRESERRRANPKWVFPYGEPKGSIPRNEAYFPYAAVTRDEA